MGIKQYLAERRARIYCKKVTKNFRKNTRRTGGEGLEGEVKKLYERVQKDKTDYLTLEEINNFHGTIGVEKGDEGYRTDLGDLLKKSKGRSRVFSALRTAANPFSNFYFNQDKVSRTVDGHRSVYNAIKDETDEKKASHLAAQQIRRVAGSSYQVKDALRGAVVLDVSLKFKKDENFDKKRYTVEKILEKDEHVGFMGKRYFKSTDKLSGKKKFNLRKTLYKSFYIPEEFTSVAFDLTALLFGGVAGLGARRVLVGGLGTIGGGLNKLGQKYSENHGNLFGATGTAIAIGGMAYVQSGAVAAAGYGGAILTGSVLKHWAHRRMNKKDYLKNSDFNRKTHGIERLSDAITMGILGTIGVTRFDSNDYSPAKVWDNIQKHDPVTQKAISMYNDGMPDFKGADWKPDWKPNWEGIKQIVSSSDKTDYSLQVDSALEDGFGQDSVTVKDGDVYVNNKLDTTDFLTKLKAVDTKDDAITAKHVDASFLAKNNPSNIHLDRVEQVNLGSWQKLVDYGRYDPLDARLEGALGTDVDINPFDSHITVHNDGMDASQMASKLSAAGIPFTLNTIEHYNPGDFTVDDFKSGDINIGYATDSMYAETAVPKPGPESIDNTKQDTPIKEQPSAMAVPKQVTAGFIKMPGDFYGKDVIVDKINSHDIDGDPCKATGNEAHLTLNKDCYNDGRILPFETGKFADTTLPKDLTLDDTFMMFEKIGPDGKAFDRAFVDVDEKGGFNVPDDFRELYNDGEKVRVSHLYASDYSADNGHATLEGLASWENFKGKCSVVEPKPVPEPVIEPLPPLEVTDFADLYNITAKVNGEEVKMPILDTPLKSHVLELGSDDKVILGSQFTNSFDGSNLTLRDMEGNPLSIPCDGYLAFCTNQLEPGKYMIDFHGKDNVFGNPAQHDHLAGIWKKDPQVNWSLEGPKDDFVLNDHDYLIFTVKPEQIDCAACAHDASTGQDPYNFELAFTPGTKGHVDLDKVFSNLPRSPDDWALRTYRGDTLNLRFDPNTPDKVLEEVTIFSRDGANIDKFTLYDKDIKSGIDPFKKGIKIDLSKHLDRSAVLKQVNTTKVDISGMTGMNFWQKYFSNNARNLKFVDLDRYSSGNNLSVCAEWSDGDIDTLKIRGVAEPIKHVSHGPGERGGGSENSGNPPGHSGGPGESPGHGGGGAGSPSR